MTTDTEKISIKNDNNRYPLFVDLDGTLIKTDLLFESALIYAKKKLLNMFIMLYWLLTGGRARLKSELAKIIELPNTSFIFQETFVSYLKAQAAAGRRIILVTASNQKYAESAAEKGRAGGLFQ